MTRSLQTMADRLLDLGVTRVVMEATSDYWKPPFYLLEAHGFQTWLVNAKDVKHLPGRPKTDRLDAVWLCKVTERQMLRPSFVPPVPIRRLRDLTRYRVGLVSDQNREKNRVEKLLEDAQIKLSVVASDIFGVSGRDMMASLIAGERNPQVLAQMARSRMRTKIPQLEEAFVGYFTDHHRFLLAKMLSRIDALDTDIADLEAQIEAQIAPFAPAVARLDEIPGVGATAAAVIIAEVGLDMTRSLPRPTLPPGPGSPQGSKSPPDARRAPGPPVTATATWPGSWARPPSGPAGPTRSWASATGASPAGEARRRPSSRWVVPSWSSSGTCYATRTPSSTTSASVTTTPASTQTVRSATTSANSKPLATGSPCNPPPDLTSPFTIHFRVSFPGPFRGRRGAGKMGSGSPECMPFPP
jgi:transposase